MRYGSATIVVVCAALAACKQPDKPKPPPSPPVITSFTVTRARISQGESVAFAYTTERASAAQLIDQTGAELPVSFDAVTGTGSATATPSASSFYVLRVTGDGGRDSAFLQVAVDEGLKTVFLVAIPAEVKPGQVVSVLWAAPGGKNVELSASGRPLVASPQESGATEDTPALSTTYRLTAKRLDGTMLTATADVRVKPVIDAFSASPKVARPGETITLSWTTSGAERAVLTEATFGQLLDTTTDVASGTFSFVVPATFGDGGVVDAGSADPDGGTDGGVDAGSPPDAVRDGTPLRFTLTARTASPAQAVSRAVDGRVGAGPIIDVFDAPASATGGRPFTLSWQTTNAARVELSANGAVLYAPPAGTGLSASFAVPGLNADTTFALTAYDFTGLEARREVRTRVVRAPQIGSFTLPATVASASSAAGAAWTTTDATLVVLRLRHGPTVYVNDVAAQVAAGMTQLHVAARSTFVLEAYNAAGERATAERTVDVVSPIALRVTPDPVPLGDGSTVSWDVSSLLPSDLPGLPAAAQSTASATTFTDLETAPGAQRLFFSNRDDGVARLAAPAGFTFPFVTGAARELFVSTNGFLALRGTGAASTNVDVSSAYTGPPLLAPFWDDLDLATDGSVSWLLDGTTFPRRLTVQWSKVEIYGEAGTSLTFQVQLFESGHFLFVYRTLTGTNADAASATVGVVAPGAFASTFSHNTASLAADQELSWFGNDGTQVTGSAPLRLSSTSQLGFFAQTAAGTVPVFTTARVLAADSLIVNEAMAQPDSTVAMGQWIELFNPGAEPMELADLTLVSTSGASAPHRLAAGTTIPAAGYLVLGQSTDTAQNGDAPVSAAWGASELPLASDDAVELQISIPDGGAFTVSRLAWTSAAVDGGTSSAPGASVQRPDPAIDASARPLVCARAKTYGTPTQTGTPGAANESCFEYRLEPIPVAYEDISTFGTPVITTGDLDEETASVTLAHAFPWFGQPKTQATISTNGWIGFGAFPSSVSTNRTAPSLTSAPVGALAAFWDDLDANAAFADAQIYLARVGDHTIVQWHHFTNWSSYPSDDENFQVKLFDSGVVEVHFAAMVSGSSANRASGVTSTVWIERPSTAATAAALPVCREQPVITSHSAWRFSPN